MKLPKSNVNSTRSELSQGAIKRLPDPRVDFYSQANFYDFYLRVFEIFKCRRVERVCKIAKMANLQDRKNRVLGLKARMTNGMEKRESTVFSTTSCV